jgi:hypothetical protein
MAMFTELDDRDPVPASVPEQRAATMARGRQLRRNRRSLVAAACTTVVLIAGLVLVRPATTTSLPPVAPAPTATPLPTPTGATLELYPLCRDTCPSTNAAGRYRSVIEGDVARLPFTVVLPAGWHSLGGDLPPDGGYYPRGSRPFSAQGDVMALSNRNGVSLMSDDGTRGLWMMVTPAVVTSVPSSGIGIGITYGAPVGGYVQWLAARSGGGRTQPTTVSGYPATSVDLLAEKDGSPIVTMEGGCQIGWPCQPLVAYHIAPRQGGGSGPPTMGRLAAAPSRIVVVRVPSSLEKLDVVIWLWDVRTSGRTTDEILRAVTPILDTLQFETPVRLSATG